MASAEKILNDKQQILSPRYGYDLIAPYYEQWKWFKFWQQNEAPIIRRWLNSLNPAFGLDAGSGTGVYIPDIIKAGHTCMAVDISYAMLSLNRKKRVAEMHNSSVLFTQANINSLPLKDSQFDWVLCTRVLSHVSNTKPVLQEFSRVLKPGGECLISDVHPDHPYTNVSIGTEQGKISLETYKHSFRSLKTAISSVDTLELAGLDEYRLMNLYSKPSRVDFEKLYRSPNSAIFYTCRLKKL